MPAFDAQMPRVPVLLVTGFLGSGKTTLVNRLLKLTEGRTAQAWARRHRQLRAALTPMVQERVNPAEVDIIDTPDDIDEENDSWPPR